MMTCSHLLKFMIIISTAAIKVSCSCENNIYPPEYCDHEEDGPIDTLCDDITETFKTAIMDNKNNLNHLRKAFFYGPNSNPVLFRIEYKVSFGEDVLILLENETATKFCEAELENYDLKYTIFTSDSSNGISRAYGWTSSGIFVVVHPGLLSWIQFQIPLVGIRLASLFFREVRQNHKILGSESRETEVFLWDGTYELPTITLNVPITSIPCIPSDQLVDLVLQDITNLVRVYAPTSVGFKKAQDFIGFTLCETSTSTTDIVTYSIGVFVVLCCISPFIITVIAFRFLKVAYEHIKNNCCIQLRLLVLFTVYLEVLIEIVLSIVWSTKTDSLSTFFIWFLMIIYKILPLTVITVYNIFQKLNIGNRSYNKVAFLQLFMLAMMFSFYVIPTILSLFVFPILVIGTFSYFVAFYYALFVFINEHQEFSPKASPVRAPSSGFNKAERLLGHPSCQSPNIRLDYPNAWFQKYFLYPTQLAFFVLFFALLSFLLYIIVIGNTSVINDHFYGVLSLLPSIALTAVTWLSKKMFLKQPKGRKSEQETTP